MGSESEKGDVLRRLQRQVGDDRFRVTVHAHQEMAEDGVSLTDVKEAFLTAKIIEDYPEHRRGACCLICGGLASGRYLHIVCTTALEFVVIITVYEPQCPKWTTPFVRGKSL